MNTVTERVVVFECESEQCVGILHAGNATRPSIGMLVIVGGPQYRAGSHRQFVQLARHVAAQGMPVLRFDYRGMGDSEGEARSFRSVAPDIRVAIDAFLQAVPGLSNVVLFGLCDAASAALLYCTSDERVAGLVLANPWVRSESGLARVHVKHYYRGRVLQGSFWRKLWSGRFNVRAAGSGFLRSASVVLRDRGAKSGAGPEVDFVAAMRRGLEKFTRPVLVVLSGRDLTASEFTDLCGREASWSPLLERHTVKVHGLADADHTFSTRAATNSFNELCTRWLVAMSTKSD